MFIGGVNSWGGVSASVQQAFASADAANLRLAQAAAAPSDTADLAAAAIDADQTSVAARALAKVLNAQQQNTEALLDILA